VLGTAAGQPVSAFAANTGVGVIGAARGSSFTALDTLYDFTNQSGTTVSDRIGANNGTLGGATLPTWTGNGLAFTAGSNVALPAALNGEKTFYYMVYVNPITTGTQPNNVYPTIMSSSTGGTGFNVVLQLPGEISNGQSDHTYTTTLYPNAVSTASLNTLSGFEVLTIVCGTGSGSLDHIYIDGVEVSYSAQASNCGAQTSGNLYLGPAQVSPWTAGYFPGTFYGFGASSTQHTAAQVQQNVSAFFALAAAKGVPTTPLPVSLAQPQLLALGDSITAGTASQTPYTSQLTLLNQPAYAISNYGIIGIRLASILSHEANRAAPLCNTQAGPAIAILEGGTNDLASINPLSPQAVWASAAAWATLMRKAGCIPFINTMISRTANGYGGQTMDALKDTYDALILQQAKSVGFAGVLDVAANPLLGADGASANTTYFQAVDHIHPTTLGNQLMGTAVSNGLNWYFGYNESNPHLLTTLTSFTMTCADGYLDLGGVTAGGNIALPDCTGASGATFRFNNPQSAYAITVTADSSAHPVNGSSAAVAIPANSTLTLRLVPNPKTTAGWHWEF
jgi:lysophospholipase L1-like esterase